MTAAAVRIRPDPAPAIGDVRAILAAKRREYPNLANDAALAELAAIARAESVAVRLSPVFTEAVHRVLVAYALADAWLPASDYDVACAIAAELLDHPVEIAEAVIRCATSRL